MTETPQAAAETPTTLKALNAHVIDRLRAAIQSLGGGDDLQLSLSRCRSPELGDLSLPCFPLRGVLSALDEKKRQNPAAIAAALAAALTPDQVIGVAKSAGPYLNIGLNTPTLISTVLGEILETDDYGSGCLGDTEHVVVEFSAPNTNKPQHLGHIRNNLLGESVSRLMAYAGHRVTKVNLINDRGIHICKSMLAYQRWGHSATPENAGGSAELTEVMREYGIWGADDFAGGPQKKGDHLIGDFYVLFDKKFREEYAAWQTSDAGQAFLSQWLEGDDGKRAVAAVPQHATAMERYAAALQKYEEDLANAPAPSGKKKKKGPRKPKAPKAPPAPESVCFSKHRDVFFNQTSELGQASRALLIAWERGDEAVISLWKQLNGWVISGFEETYKDLGVSFEKVYYESQTYMLGKEIITQGLSDGHFHTREDGATLFALDKIGKKGDKVVLRSDGTSVYITQDLGTAIARHNELGFDRMVYVVGSEQEYHFEVLFGVLGHIREALKGHCEHLSYGMVHLPHGRMKSREGTVVDADTLIAEMQGLVLKEIEGKADSEHYTETSDAEKTHRARTIGLAALKYFLLDVTPKSDMLFNPEKALDFAGRTGVYALYNYARTRSLIRKGGGTPEFSRATLSVLGTPEERRIVSALSEWPKVLEWAASTLDPAKISEYLYSLCKGFAFIFTDKKNHPIATCPDPVLRDARLLLVEAFSKILNTGLRLLTIDTLEEM